MRPIFYGGRLAALAEGDCVIFAPHINVLEADHPLRRFISAVCLWSCEVDAQRYPVPWNPAAAEAYARDLLMPAAFFDALDRGLADHVLAQDFNVPLEQVELRREDLAPEQAGG